MNVDALRYFVAVAHNKSISKAAQELFITQSALSRNLYRLEEEIGVPLFERSRGTMVCKITEAGAACLHEAEIALEHIDNMLFTIKTFGTGERGSLTIGFSGYEDVWFLEWMRRIRSNYPGIELYPKRMNWGELGQGVLDRSIDIAIFDSGFLPAEENCLRYIEIADAKLQIIVSKEHPFSGRSFVTVDELRDQDFIGYQREISPFSFDAFCHLCMQHGFSPHLVALYDNTRMVLSDIYSNRGIGRSTSLMPLDETQFSRIDVQLEAGDMYPDSKQSLVYRADNPSPCLKNVIRLAKELKDSMS